MSDEESLRFRDDGSRLQQPSGPIGRRNAVAGAGCRE